MSHDPNEGSFIDRCPHDQDNPYAQISRDLIRDKSLSPNGRWFVIYLLSHEKSFRISMPWVANTQGLSKDKLYRIIDECIEAGYLQKIKYSDGNLTRYRYLVSESPKFKKILRCPENQDTGNQDTEKQDSKKDKSSSYEEERKTNKRGSSAVASEIANFFLEKIKEKKPDFKPKAFEKWPEHIDAMIRIDKREPDRIKSVITWLVGDLMNLVYVQSSKKLRDDFDRLEIKMQAKANKSRINMSREYAVKLKAKYPEQMGKMSFDSDYVRNVYTGKEVPFDLPFETFKEALVNMFGGTHGQ